MLRYYFFFILLLVSFNLFSQTLYLRPTIGRESQFSSFGDRGLKPKPISKVPSKGWSGGIALMLDVKDYSFEVNLYNGDAGSGTAIKSKNDSLGTSTTLKDRRSVYENRLSFNVSKPLMRVKIPRKKYNFIDKLLRLENKPVRVSFDINAQAGLAITRFALKRTIDTLNSVNVSFGSTNDLSLDLIDSSLRRQHGIRLELGSYIQFYKEDKKQLRIGVLFGLGLVQRWYFLWSSSANGEEFEDFATISRGTTLSAYISYPIRLKTFRKKESKT